MLVILIRPNINENPLAIIKSREPYERELRIWIVKKRNVIIPYLLLQKSL